VSYKERCMHDTTVILIVAALSVLFFPAGGYASPCSLTGLQWMAGDWRNPANPAGAQERWSVAPGGVLMGSAWEASQDGKGYAEIMTVREESGSIQMIMRHFDLALGKAWEERTTPMAFVGSACDGMSATLDGQDDHAGEHLTYSLSGKTLLIIGDFLHHEQPHL
jgi:hypothetical protein